MGLQKSIDYVYVYGRYVLLFTCLILLQISGFITPFLDANPILRVDNGLSLFTAIFIIWAGHGLIWVGVVRLWNWITPIKDKATHIETQIVDMLAFAFGTGLSTLVFLDLPLLSACQLIMIVALAYLPSMAFGWSLQVWYAKRWPVEPQTDVEGAEAAHNEPALAKDLWRERLAYVFAAFILAVTMTLATSIIVYMRTGTMNGLYLLATNCGVMAFFLLSIFGSNVVGVGILFLERIGLKVISLRRRMALGYMSGYLVILTFFVALSLILKRISTPDYIISWWAMGGAYAITAFSALLAGIGFSYFFIPKHEVR